MLKQASKYLGGKGRRMKSLSYKILPQKNKQIKIKNKNVNKIGAEDMTQWEGKYLPMVSETMSLIPSTTKKRGVVKISWA